MKLLFVGAGTHRLQGIRSKWILKQSFVKKLEERGIEVQTVDQKEILGRRILKPFPVLNASGRKKFERLLDGFGPDAVLMDSPYTLGSVVVARRVPLLVCFWDHWMNRRMAKKDGGIVDRLTQYMRARMMDPCLRSATVILAETSSISETIRGHYPESRVETFPYSNIDSDYWRCQAGRGSTGLKHPCVGLLQHAESWSKTQEMSVLSGVIAGLPQVTFYWAGDGRYRDRILPQLSGFDNFEHLGALEYPDGVREYLASIDIYGMASGIEMSPYSLKQAMSMERPAIATDVGGVSETMRDKKTGLLVRRGDRQGWIEGISMLLSDTEKAQEMGRRGRRFVLDNWDSGVAADRLVRILKEIAPG